MMFDDENEPRKQLDKIKNLEPMSVEELRNYIAEMKEEIIRVEREIKNKQAHMDAASSFFK